MLLNDNNPLDNEFFNIKKVFEQIAQDPEKAEVVKIQILIGKARELYQYLEKAGMITERIKALKYTSAGAVQTEMTIEETMREAEKAFTHWFDQDTAKYNYSSVIEALKKRINYMKVYEPFFENMVQIIAAMQPKFKELERLKKGDQEKQDLMKELNSLRKQKLLLEETLKEKETEIKNVNDAWELQTAEQFSQLAESLEKYKFISSLPLWEELSEDQIGTVSKVLAYCILRNKDELTASDLADKLNIKDVPAIANLPFIKFTKNKFKVDFDGMKTHLAQKQKIDFRVDHKHFLVEIKDGIQKQLDKIKRKMQKNG